MTADVMAVQLLKRWTELDTQRSTWESLWQDIADYCVPRKADITRKRSAGDNRAERLFDATAVHSAELLAASLHGMLTNAATSWFSLRYRDPFLDELDEAKEWLQETEEVLYTALARSNFQEQIHELYSDLVTFGTGVMMIEEDDKDDLRFSTRHIAECYLSENDKGRVDTVYRKFKLSARAATDKFGEDKVSQKILKLSESNPYELVTLLHVVRPREERDITKSDSQNLPFMSCYLDPEAKQVLSVGGFNENPYLCPRFLKSSYEQNYGRSPSSSSISDIKMINKMSEVSIRSAQKQVDPPLMVPDDGFMLPIRTVPSGLNFYRSGTRDRIEPLNTGANNPIGIQMEEQRRQAIRQAFYVDQLILGAGPNMTATEVVQRTEEKMRLLGPVLGRLQAELLQPLIERCFAVLSRKKSFPEPPEVLGESTIEIEYVSPLAKAQRTGDVQSLTRLFELVTPLAQIDQGVLDYMDTDGMVKHLIKTVGVPAVAVRSKEQVDALRSERQQQAAEQQQIMEAQQTATSAGEAAPMVKALGGPDGINQLLATEEGQ